VVVAMARRFIGFAYNIKLYIINLDKYGLSSDAKQITLDIKVVGKRGKQNRWRKSSCPHRFLTRRIQQTKNKIGENAKIARALTEGRWSRGAAVRGAVMQIVAARAAA
jgi:hypothetical protein